MTRKKKSDFIPSAGAKKSPKPKFQQSNRLSENIFTLIKNKGSKVDFATFYVEAVEKYGEHPVQRALKLLKDEGKIKTTGNGKIEVTPKKLSKEREPQRATGKLIRGTVDMTRSGDLFIVTEGKENKDVFVQGRNSGSALDGDVVDVKLKSGGRSNRPEGIVVQVVKRSAESYEGSLHITKAGSFFKPNEPKIKRQFRLADEETTDCKDGEMVIARILNWDRNNDNNAEATLIERLINIRKSDLDMKRILIQNGFHTDFARDVYSELSKIPNTIPQAEIDNRKDYRDVLTFTIDPEDAKDFDDAISIQTLPNGLIEVGVHIADVSYYIKEGSALDKEGEKRATSVYLPDRVCPMLPERLSNELCSLRPNEDKLTFAAIFAFEPTTFEVKEVSFGKTVIHSNKRFTYEQVQEIIEKKEGLYADEILLLDKIAKHRRKLRFEAGAISFEKDEVRFKLDENGKPIGIVLKVRKDAHLLVEDFMLMANEYVAKFGAKIKVSKQPSPFVYRTHDRPDQGKLEQFSHIAKRFGYQVSFKNAKDVSGPLNAMLKKVQGKPEQNLLEGLAIRSMAKAEYTTKNIGHFGLGMPYYTHFTSPIRRYPDVLVHRLLFAALQNEPLKLSKDDIENACKSSSLMERKANDAEREAIKYKQVEYMEDKVGQQFDGIISGVIARGVFVEIIKNKCEGMIPVEELGTESFIFDEVNISLMGNRTGTEYRMGDPIRVLVKKTNIEDRRIDLGLA